MGYSNSEGQEIGNDSERMTGRVAITIRPVQKLTINATINGSVSTNNGLPEESILWGMLLLPIVL